MQWRIRRKKRKKYLFPHIRCFPTDHRSKCREYGSMRLWSATKLFQCSVFQMCWARLPLPQADYIEFSRLLEFRCYKYKCNGSVAIDVQGKWVGPTFANPVLLSLCPATLLGFGSGMSPEQRSVWVQPAGMEYLWRWRNSHRRTLARHRTSSPVPWVSLMRHNPSKQQPAKRK